MEKTAQAQKAGEKEMTVEKRQFISLDEIKGIRYRCVKCGITVSIPREQWGKPQRYCPGECGDAPSRPTAWIGMNTYEDTEMLKLQEAVKALIEHPASGCELALEVSCRGSGEGD